MLEYSRYKKASTKLANFISCFSSWLFALVHFAMSRKQASIQTHHSTIHSQFGVGIYRAYQQESKCSVSTHPA